MRFVLTEKAEGDLEEIGEEIALDNPARAVTFIQELRRACKNIVDFPEGFPLAPEYGKNVRKLPHGNYLILYTLTEDAVVILHIRYGARLARILETNTPIH